MKVKYHLSDNNYALIWRLRLDNYMVYWSADRSRDVFTRDELWGWLVNLPPRLDEFRATAMLATLDEENKDAGSVRSAENSDA